MIVYLNNFLQYVFFFRLFVRPFSFFKRYGIPHPQYSRLTGNLPDIMRQVCILLLMNNCILLLIKTFSNTPFFQKLFLVTICGYALFIFPFSIFHNDWDLYFKSGHKTSGAQLFCAYFIYKNLCYANILLTSCLLGLTLDLYKIGTSGNILHQ